MRGSNQRVARFLEKEIKTYLALSLFFSKRDFKEHALAGARKALISPAFYKDRMKEAKKLVHELKHEK
jgi:hypothetical protein